MAAPYSNPFTRAQIIDKINSLIGTSLTSTWTDAKIDDLIDVALDEISEAVPYIMVDIYQLETRRGLATSTSSNNLVDATNAQFLSTDTGKVIYNTTDKTWAQIQSYSSASQVGLTKDIMASGEGYEVYNKNCWNHRQLNIEDSGDFLGVIGAVYPVEPNMMFSGSKNNMRNVELSHQNKIAELDIWYYENTKDTTANKDVHLYLARQHHLEYATDLAGVVNNGSGYSAGDTSMAVDGLGDTVIYTKGSLFYFTTIDAVTMDSRLMYRLTADMTTSANAGTISFFPALECNVSDDDTIQFVRSTLTPELERVLIDLVTGEILHAEGISKINTVPVGGAGTARTFLDEGLRLQERARRDLKALVDVDEHANIVYAR